MILCSSTSYPQLFGYVRSFKLDDFSKSSLLHIYIKANDFTYHMRCFFCLLIKVIRYNTVNQRKKIIVIDYSELKCLSNISVSWNGQLYKIVAFIYVLCFINKLNRCNILLQVFIYWVIDKRCQILEVFLNVRRIWSKSNARAPKQRMRKYFCFGSTKLWFCLF